MIEITDLQYACVRQKKGMQEQMCHFVCMYVLSFITRNEMYSALYS